MFPFISLIGGEINRNAVSHWHLYMTQISVIWLSVQLLSAKRFVHYCVGIKTLFNLLFQPAAIGIKFLIWYRLHSSFWQMNIFTYLINSPNTDKYMFKVGQIISIDLKCLHKAFVLFVDTWFVMWKFLWWSRYLTWKIIWLLLDRFWELTLEIQFYVVDDTIFKYYFSSIHTYLIVFVIR